MPIMVALHVGEPGASAMTLAEQLWPVDGGTRWPASRSRLQDAMRPADGKPDRCSAAARVGEASSRNAARDVFGRQSAPAKRVQGRGVDVLRSDVGRVAAVEQVRGSGEAG